MLLIAIGGSWLFDRISVPSQYMCSAPFVRLDDEFCGAPISIAYLFFAILDLPNILTGLLACALRVGDASRPMLFFLFLFLLFLPLISTTILILRGENRRDTLFWLTYQQIFTCKYSVSVS
jgi:hypothetical protein